MFTQHDAPMRVALVCNQQARADVLCCALEKEFEVEFIDANKPGPDHVQHRPDVLVCDLPMSGTLDAQLSALRAYELFKDVPVAMLFDRYDEDVEAGAIAAGVSDCLVRSVHPQVLRHRLRTRIESQRFNAQKPPGYAPTSGSVDDHEEAKDLALALFNDCPQTMTIRGRDGRYLLVNNAALQFAGANEEDFIGKRPEETPGVTLRSERHDALVARTLQAYVYERPFTTPDGERTIRISVFPLFDANGRLRAIGRIGTEVEVSFASDGGRDASMQTISRQDAMLSAILEHVPGTMAMRDLEGRHLLLNEAVAQIIGKPTSQILGRTLEELGHPADEIMAHERAVVSTNKVIEQRRWVTRADGTPSERHIIKYPVRDTDGTVFAVGTNDVDITTLGQVERALHEREENFRILVEGSIQGIYIHRDLRTLFANQAFADIHGYASVQDILALKTMHPLLASGERERLASYAAARTRDGDAPVRYEYQALRKDGRVVTLQCTASIVAWEGERAIQATVVDVTEQRNAVQRLRESEARFRAFFDNSPHGMSIQGIDGHYLEENAGARRLYGHAVDEIAGKRPEDLWPKSIAKNVIAVNKRVLLNRESVEYENEVVVDGQRKWIRVAKFPIVDSEGVILAIGSIGSDLTAWKNADRKLRASRRQFRDFARASSDWFWEMDAELRLTRITEQGIRAMDDESIAGFNRVLSLDDSESADADRTQRGRAWHQFRERLKACKDIRDVELPVKDPALGLRYIRVSARVLINDDGEFEGYRGVGTDITTYVRSARQAEMLRAAVDVSADALVLYDEQWRVVFSSKRFHEIFSGIPAPGELRGVTRQKLRRYIVEGGGFGGSKEEVERYLDSATMEETVEPEERTFANGRTYLRRVEKTGDGALLLQLHDVTELKNAQRTLETHQMELQRLASEVSLAEERERRRIATELHDGAVQNLGLARIRIGALLRKHDDPATREAFAQLRDMIARSVRELRSLMSELSPPMLYEFGLPPALEWLAKHFETHHDLACSASVPEASARLSNDITVFLFQAARELLMNVVKHAEAENARLVFTQSAAMAELRVSDDGVGFVPSGVDVGGTESGGFGLFSVRERVQLIGGTVTIEPASPGVEVTLRVPL